METSYDFSKEDFCSKWWAQPLMFSHNQRDYVFMMQFDPQSPHLKKQLNCWIYGFQTTEDLAGSRCKITLYGKESVTFKGPIISAEVRSSDVEKDGIGLVVPAHFVMRNFVDKEISVNVKILSP
jgi:hypothetical protein